MARRAPKAAHHKGSYQRRAKRVTDEAYANPFTVCTCGRTLEEHPPTRDRGNPPKWSAGHVVKGEIDGALVPQVLGCNVAEENEHRNAQRRGGGHVSLDW